MYEQNYLFAYFSEMANSLDYLIDHQFTTLEQYCLRTSYVQIPKSLLQLDPVSVSLSPGDYILTLEIKWDFSREIQLLIQ